MRVSVIRPRELGEAELNRWRAIQQADPAFDNPFLSPEFTCTVGELRHHVRVAVLEEGSDVVGFFPFERHALGIGKPVAAGLTDAQDMVLDKDVKLDPRWLIKQCGRSPSTSSTTWWTASRWPRTASRSDTPRRSSTCGTASTSASTRSRTPHARHIAQRCIRHASSNATWAAPPRLRHYLGRAAQDPARLEDRPVQKTGPTDRFAQQWIVERVERLQATRSESFAGVLDMTYVDGRPMAGHFGTRTRTTLAAWSPAYNTAFAKYSPGFIQHLAMAERSADDGVVVVDLGRGEKEYKDKLKNGEFAVVEGRVATAGPRAAVHWMMRMPARKAKVAVIENPLLHRSADRALKMYGRLRTAVEARP
jgi:CelD/BcsL family acetyltransferase involved in cellulose biosynthesis